ncbi:MAG TPA: metal ABC transporter substrate-binding protein [Gemmatimonadaceae bacterium]|nr:metal ABC transporter substrate-binding protein [Gemmatimonadaceae bacterium]
MHRRTFVAALAAFTLAGPTVLAAPAAAQLKVVTSTTDLYDIATAVGGKYIEASHIGEGYQDPHFIEAKPSFVLKLRDADVWAFVGLDLEIGWMPLLLQGARNQKIMQGGSGYLDVSKAVPVLDVPSGNVDRSQGDVHPLGNPHYWLEPENGKRMAGLFAQKFSQLDPAHAAAYQANAKAFAAKVDATTRALAPQLAAIKGKPIVAWHTSWRYFADYTGANIVGFMEPKPGVPPSPSHLAGLIQTMKRTGAKVIIMEPFYDRKMADFVAKNVPGTKVLVLPPSVGGVRGVDDYVALIRHDVTQLAAAVQ